MPAIVELRERFGGVVAVEDMQFGKPPEHKCRGVRMTTAAAKQTVGFLILLPL
jgi:hypothetical protein